MSVSENKLRSRVRRIRDPYVIVMHKESRRKYVLDGGYCLMKQKISEEDIEILWSMFFQEWDGWKPSCKNQIPKWAWEIPSTEFISRWIAK